MNNNSILKNKLLVLLIAIPLTSFADDLGNGSFVNAGSAISTAASNASSSGGISNISKYLENLGYYLGFPITTTPTTIPTATTYQDAITTPDIDATVYSQYAATTGYLAQTGLVTDTSADITVVPSSFSTFADGIPYNIINSLTSSTYSTWASYGSGDSVSGITPLSFAVPYTTTDSSGQQSSTYGPTMVSSMLETMMGTFDVSACTPGNNPTTTYPTTGCTVANNFQTASQLLNVTTTVDDDNIIYSGFPATATQYSAPTADQIATLDASGIIEPLAYNSTEAANVSKIIFNFLAPSMMYEVPYTVYNNILSNITNGENNPGQVNSAARTLFTYLLGNNAFGAQVSVGLDALQSIVARRMVNPLTGSSTAFDENVMATRRLLNAVPTGTGAPSTTSNTWLNSMQTASPIVIQRETLYLLAEIRYELYQTRMLQERLLLLSATQQLQSAGMSAMSSANTMMSASSSTSTS